MDDSVDELGELFLAYCMMTDNWLLYDNWSISLSSITNTWWLMIMLTNEWLMYNNW